MSVINLGVRCNTVGQPNRCYVAFLLELSSMCLHCYQPNMVLTACMHTPTAANHHHTCSMYDIQHIYLHLSYVPSFCGLQIDRGTAYGLFPGDWSAIYKCTFALAYALVASYLVLFFLFWLCKSAFIDNSTTTVILESSEYLFSCTASCKHSLVKCSPKCVATAL